MVWDERLTERGVMPRPAKQATCCPEKPHYAKGLCVNCYMKQRREEGPRAECHPEQVRYTKDGLCYNCYLAQRPPAYCHADRPRYTDDGICQKCYLILRNYGLTPIQYDMMYAAQGGCCAISICNEEPTDVDHDHDTGAVRGLLCRRHNIMAGFLESRPDVEATTNYLNYHKTLAA